MLKGLNQFEVFNWEEFAKGKVFMATNTAEYKDYDTQEHLGTKVECTIVEDKTHYIFKDNKVFSNRFEKITFKVLKDVKIPIDAIVIPKNVTAKVYGEYRNQMSVRCDDIEVVTPKEK